MFFSWAMLNLFTRHFKIPFWSPFDCINWFLLLCIICCILCPTLAKLVPVHSWNLTYFGLISVTCAFINLCCQKGVQEGREEGGGYQMLPQDCTALPACLCCVIDIISLVSLVQITAAIKTKVKHLQQLCSSRAFFCHVRLRNSDPSFCSKQ